MNPKAYIFLGVILGFVLWSLQVNTANASKIDNLRNDQAAKDRKYNERKSLQDTINAQTIKLLEEQQNEIDALKKRLGK